MALPNPKYKLFSFLTTIDFFTKGRTYGKVAYFELSSHQISELKQQAKRENIRLAKISEMLAN